MTTDDPGWTVTRKPLDIPSNHLGLMRTIPPKPSDNARRLLTELLQQEEGWHLRGAWSAWLGGERFEMTPIDELTPDQRIAAVAWLRQQRHALHRVIEDVHGREPHRAPDGWVESQPIYAALEAVKPPPGPRDVYVREHPGPGYVPEPGPGAGVGEE